MPILPVKLPPGIFRNGTRYQAKGRWFSADRVRWYNGSMRPIGGWEAKGVNLSDPGEYVRNGHAWRDNLKNQYAVWGTNERLLWLKGDGSIEDINDATTPVVSAGPAHPVVPAGYGTGLYGVGLYGITAVDPDEGSNAVGRWKFDNWGENLLALPDWDMNLYQWVPGAGNILTAVSGAPTGITDFVVTQERIVMTIGGADLRLVQWSDQEDNTDWTPGVTNQAGSYVLPGTGKLLGIYKLRNQILILSETDAWVARYLGPPYVYGFEKVGDNCAPVHRCAAVPMPDGTLMWYGTQNFWRFDGAVQEMPCDVVDYLKADLDSPNTSKMFAWVNSDYREVWFHYPSVQDDPVTGSSVVPAGVECGRYVSWSWETGAWSQGTLKRTAAIPRGVYPYPQMTDWDGEAYWHERVGVNFDDGVSAKAKSGPIELGDGDRNLAVTRVYTDSQGGEWDDGPVPKGAVRFRFSHRQTPNGAEIDSPYYEYAPKRNQPTPVRVMGRDLMLEVEGSADASINWEWGDFRLEVQNQGTGVR